MEMSASHTFQFSHMECESFILSYFASHSFFLPLSPISSDLHVRCLSVLLSFSASYYFLPTLSLIPSLLTQPPIILFFRTLPHVPFTIIRPLFPPFYLPAIFSSFPTSFLPVYPVSRSLIPPLRPIPSSSSSYSVLQCLYLPPPFSSSFSALLRSFISFDGTSSIAIYRRQEVVSFPSILIVCSRFDQRHPLGCRKSAPRATFEASKFKSLAR